MRTAVFVVLVLGICSAVHGSDGQNLHRGGQRKLLQGRPPALPPLPDLSQVFGSALDSASSSVSSATDKLAAVASAVASGVASGPAADTAQNLAQIQQAISTVIDKLVPKKTTIGDLAPSPADQLTTLLSAFSTLIGSKTSGTGGAVDPALASTATSVITSLLG